MFFKFRAFEALEILLNPSETLFRMSLAPIQMIALPHSRRHMDSVRFSNNRSMYILFETYPTLTYRVSKMVHIPTFDTHSSHHPGLVCYFDGVTIIHRVQNPPIPSSHCFYIHHPSRFLTSPRGRAVLLLRGRIVAWIAT